MAGLVDDVMSMKAMGKRPLWMQPLDLVHAPALVQRAGE